jgi:NADH:ubiquinone oxidoreductase subunit E
MKKEGNRKQYIFVCHGKDCFKKGAKEVHQGLEKALKGSKKSSCCLVKTRCMDHCKEGPSVVVDGIWYGKVSSKDLQKIVEKKAAT